MEDGRVIKWAAHYTNGEVIAARDVVLSIGRDLYIPEIFRPLLGTRVFHSENYLSAIHQYASKPNLRVAVIGSAQSSAEIFRAVHDDLPSCSPTIIMRKIGFRYYETNPFFNELFYPSQVENFYSLGKSARESILEQMHYTNYGGVAPYLLNELYRLIYQQRARGQKVSKIVTTSDIVEARSESSGIRLVMKDILTGKVTEAVYDLVILGTGFENKPPRLMDSISEHLEQDSDLPVTRFYGVRALPHVEAGLYLQGYSEATHGISDSLLSILAFRSMEILEAIAKTRGHEESESLRKMSVKHAEPA
jgi:L-ornithine N5-oxygenase